MCMREGGSGGGGGGAKGEGNKRYRETRATMKDITATSSWTLSEGSFRETQSSRHDSKFTINTSGFSPAIGNLMFLISSSS